MPAWADFAAMAKGQRMIASYAPFMAASLFSGSLVGGAMFYKAALVTSMTGMFSGNPTQRLTETTAMVTRMAMPGSVEPGGGAHEVLLRVRLLHAGLRRFLVDSGRFRHPTEVPINQHDLAITLALFCYVNIRNLLQMGIRLDRAQIDSFVLLWRYAGHVLGIDPALLPTTIEEQQAFYLVELQAPGASRQGDAADQDAARRGRQAGQGSSRIRSRRPSSTRSRATCPATTTSPGCSSRIAGDYYGVRGLRYLGRAVSFTHRYLPFGERVLYGAGVHLYRRELAKNEQKKRYHYRVQTDEKTAYRAEKAHG